MLGHGPFRETSPNQLQTSEPRTCRPKELVAAAACCYRNLTTMELATAVAHCYGNVKACLSLHAHGCSSMTARGSQALGGIVVTKCRRVVSGALFWKWSLHSTELKCCTRLDCTTSSPFNGSSRHLFAICKIVSFGWCVKMSKGGQEINVWFV